MNKKIILFFIITYCPISLFSQITSGVLSFVLIDSFTHEYNFINSKILNDSIIDDLEDTVIINNNGELTMKIINRDSYKDYYESKRDTFIEYFTKSYIITDEQDALVKIYDLDKHKSSNYKYDGYKYKKIRDFKMYKDFRKKGKIIDLIEDRNDVKYINNLKGYKITFKEKFGDFITIIKMYVCEGIQYPIKMLVNYPKDVKICPIYIEQYEEKTPKNKRIILINSVQEISENNILDRIKKIK